MSRHTESESGSDFSVGLVDTRCRGGIAGAGCQSLPGKATFPEHRQFALSVFTRFEIARGFKEKGATTQLTRFREFCRHSLVLRVTEDIFDRVEDLWVMARQSGLPHSDADLIIAATALENGRVLVTGNTAHYSWIPGLTLEDWRTVSPS